MIDGDFMTGTSTSGVSGRYAKALMLAANDSAGKNVIASLVAGAASLQGALLRSDDVQSFLANPLVSAADKVAVLDKTVAKFKLPKESEKLFKNTVQVLAENSRLDILVDVLAAFVALIDASEGRITATVTSAVALTSAQKKDIEKWVLSMEKNAKAVTLNEAVDAELIAGVKVRVGSREFDASTAGRLSALKQSLNV